MVFIPTSGVHFTSPYDFFKAEQPANGLNLYNDSTVAQVSTTAGFFTQADTMGVSDDTNWTANTYKTILTVSSGPGLISHVIGPTSLAGTPTTTFGFAIDGAAEVEVAVTLSTTAVRAVLGAYVQPTFFTTANNMATGAASMNASKSVSRLNNTMAIPNLNGMRMMGMPCLRWRNSITIRMKVSENNSTTTNRERSSAVLYALGVSV